LFYEPVIDNNLPEMVFFRTQTPCPLEQYLFGPKAHFWNPEVQARVKITDSASRDRPRHCPAIPGGAKNSNLLPGQNHEYLLVYGDFSGNCALDYELGFRLESTSVPAAQNRA
jgi:hypothetical protein